MTKAQKKSESEAEEAAEEHTEAEEEKVSSEELARLETELEKKTLRLMTDRKLGSFLAA